ncbi:MAG: energy transducer TonB [Bacteroidetes bacterium]|nr:energy transducer TonB [Bacteroidota bacterium]
MKKLVLLSVSMICFIIGFAQTDKQNIKVVTNTEPSFPKGDNALYTYILYNVNYSDEAKKKYLVGDVTISFDVKPDSVVANVVVISGVGYGVDEEVKRLIQTLKFSPGVQNGTTVKMNTMYTFPIKAH